MNTNIFDLGKIGITLGREYDNNVIYEKLTIVLYKGKSYISTKTTQGISPEQDILTWQLVAEAKDAYQMLVDAGKITLSEEEFLEQLVDATKGRYIVQGNVINAADEEDLTVEHSDLLGIDTLKLANRNNTKGMGYIILRKNKSFAEQVTKSDTIYEIRYKFDLEGATITIPKNCVLKFEGGKIINGELIGQNTYINTPNVCIFNTEVLLKGVFNNSYYYPEWFGAVGDGQVDDSNAVQACIDSLYPSNYKIMCLTNRFYKIDKTIYLYENTNITSLYNRYSAYGELPEFIFYGTGNAFEFKIKYNRNGLRYSLNGFSIRNSSNLALNGIDLPDTEPKVLIEGSIKSLSISGFNNGCGIHFYCKNSSGVTQTRSENLSCFNCLLGIHFEGNVGNGNTPWMNGNVFKDCYFSYNKNGGIFIDKFSTSEDNDFFNCSIEQNGTDYDDATYEKYGAFGVSIQGSGNNRFTNCYFEGNYPNKKDSSGNYIYPSDILENQKCASIVANGTNIIVESNILAAFINLVKMYRSRIVLKNNSFFMYGNTKFESTTGKKVPTGLIDIYETNNNFKYNSIVCHQIESDPTSKFIKSTINKIHSSITNFVDDSLSIYVDIKTTFENDSNLINTKKYYPQSVIRCYANSSSIEPSGILYGTIPAQPLIDICDTFRLHERLANNDCTYHIKLLGNAKFESKSTNPKLNRLNIIVDGDNKHLVCGSNLGQAISVNNCSIVFNNCILDLNYKGTKYGFFRTIQVDSNNIITFNNCTFNINCDNSINNASFISFVNGGLNNYVYINNCIFNLGTDSPYNKFYFINTIGKSGRETNQTIIRDTNSVYNDGLTSAILGESYTNLSILPKTPYPNLPVCYQGKWVYYTGTKWVDVTGTDL